jgi:hypothetical protein
MTTNFKISSFTEIDFNGRVLDLHNNYSFINFKQNNDTSEIKIYFDKAKGDWVPKNEFDKLTFTLTNVHYLKTIEPNTELAVDDNCLAGITFFTADDRVENYALVDQADPKSNDDIIFTFESDRVIRVCCDNCSLTCV